MSLIYEIRLAHGQAYPYRKEMSPVIEVVAALIWNENRFLACQRSEHKARGLMWEFPGGKIEPGETGQEAVVRECMEELGVTVEAGEAYCDVIHHYPDVSIHLTLYNTRVIQGTPQKLEHRDLQWFSVAETDRYPFCPADRVFLTNLKERESSREERP